MNINLNKYNIFLFWNIGRNVYEKESLCENIIKKYSDYYSYYFGNSLLFTRENIHLMKRLYLNFPIFHKKLESISWEQYILLLKVNNLKERRFYFYLSLLFHSNYEDTYELIKNNYYLRLQSL